MAKEELFHHPYFGWVVGAYGAFPVKRNRLDRQALQQALSILKEGKVLGLFPEGTRSRQGQLRPGLPGIALMAVQSGVPILPIGITGSQRIQSLRDALSFPRITVNIGVPFQLRPAEGKVDREQLTAATEVVMKRIAELLPPEYQGAYRSAVMARAS